MRFLCIGGALVTLVYYARQRDTHFLPLSAALGFMFQPVPSMGGPASAFPPGFGYELWVAYAVWIAIVFALYPVCRWFAAVKQRRRDWWLSYL